MTKEELEREARINLKRRFGEFFPQLTISYIMGAEPREKQIADLEAQIEKMKCCSNCVYLAECDLSGYEECKNFDKWELREIKENGRH